MLFDGNASRSDDTKLSRRSFLASGAAAGGGLLPSLSLPFGQTKAAALEDFTPNHSSVSPAMVGSS
jgi:isoquinoline 1-oxidoreductase beta subunit